MPATDPITARSGVAAELARARATAPAADRPMLLATCNPDGTVLALWQMPAHTPGGLVQQVHEVTTTREVSPESVGLVSLDPAGWHLTRGEGA